MSVAIYLDLDGVMCDFVKSAHRVFKDFHVLNGLYSDEINCEYKSELRNRFIKSIAETPNFWHTLDWVENGERLYNFIIDNFDTNTISVLTAPMANDPNCHAGKIHWVETHIPEIRNIIIEEHKYLYVNSMPANHQILIDDRKKNIDLWIKAGGIGILHNQNNLDKTLSELSKFLA